MNVVFDLVWYVLMVVCVFVLTGVMGMMVTLVCVDGTIGDVCVCRL